MAPIVTVSGSFRSGRDGAIAQLGERVVRNDEVGGSIPPGSTTLRPSGFAWRSHARARRAKRGARHSPKGDDGLLNDPPPHFPVNLGARFSIKLATPSLKSLPFSATCISRLASMVASASVWNGTS